MIYCYLFSVRHEVYCQGYEYVTEDYVVHAEDEKSAEDKLLSFLKNCKIIKRKTIR